MERQERNSRATPGSPESGMRTIDTSIVTPLKDSASEMRVRRVTPPKESASEIHELNEQDLWIKCEQKAQLECKTLKGTKCYDMKVKEMTIKMYRAQKKRKKFKIRHSSDKSMQVY